MAASSIEDIDTRAYKAKKEVPSHIRDPNQNWAVMSIVAPNGLNQKAEELCVMMYGCCRTEKEAKELAQKARDTNDMFDVFVAPTYEWLPLPPKLEEVQEHNYTNDKIQSIHDNFLSHLRGEKADMTKRLEEVARLKAEDKLKKEQAQLEDGTA